MNSSKGTKILNHFNSSPFSSFRLKKTDIYGVRLHQPQTQYAMFHTSSTRNDPNSPTTKP